MKNFIAILKESNKPVKKHTIILKLPLKHKMLMNSQRL